MNSRMNESHLCLHASPLTHSLTPSLLPVWGCRLRASVKAERELLHSHQTCAKPLPPLLFPTITSGFPAAHKPLPTGREPRLYIYFEAWLRRDTGTRGATFSGIQLQGGAISFCPSSQHGHSLPGGCGASLPTKAPLPQTCTVRGTSGALQPLALVQNRPFSFPTPLPDPQGRAGTQLQWPGALHR